MAWHDWHLQSGCIERTNPVTSEINYTLYFAVVVEERYLWEFDVTKKVR